MTTYEMDDKASIIYLLFSMLASNGCTNKGRKEVQTFILKRLVPVQMNPYFNNAFTLMIRYKMMEDKTI